MTTLVLDDLCAPQREVLAAMPILDACEWRAPGGEGFAAYFSSLGASRSPRRDQSLTKHTVVDHAALRSSADAGAGA